MRRALHRQALRLGPSDLTDDGAKEVLALFTDDGETLRQGLQDGVQRLGRYPAKIVVLTLFALLVAPLTTFHIALPLFACWWLLRRQAVGVKAARLVATHRSDRALRLLAEGLTKARVVRGFGMEEFESDRFNTHLGRYQSDLAAANRKARLSRGLARAALVVAGAVVLAILGAKVLNTDGAFTPAHALLLLGIAACLLEPLGELADLHRDRHAAAVAADRIYRYLNRVPEVGQAVGAKFLQPLSRALEFDDVHYTDPRGRKLLDGVTVTLPAGAVTAIAASGPARSEGSGQPAAPVPRTATRPSKVRRRGHRLGHARKPAGRNGLRRRRRPLLHRHRAGEPHRRRSGGPAVEGDRRRQDRPRPQLRPTLSAGLRNGARRVRGDIHSRATLSAGLGPGGSPRSRPC